MTEPIVVVLDSWPMPNGSPEAVIFATESRLFLRYFTGEEEVAIIQFPLVKSFKFGAPNDEALAGHPLSKFGLKYYSVHRIDNSPWIAELENKNSIHHRHDKDRFLTDIAHYVFTFQDSTLECVVKEGKFWAPEIKVAVSEEGLTIWRTIIIDATQ